MGTRYLNMIAIKPGISLSAEVAKYLNSNTCDVVSDALGTLVVYESNFTPLNARDGKGENCTYDLEEEIAVQRFLGAERTSDFFMIRAGNDDIDTRGSWLDHPFESHPLVRDIATEYKKITAEAFWAPRRP